MSLSVSPEVADPFPSTRGSWCKSDCVFGPKVLSEHRSLDMSLSLAVPRRLRFILPVGVYCCGLSFAAYAVIWPGQHAQALEFMDYNKRCSRTAPVTRPGCGVVA